MSGPSPALAEIRVAVRAAVTGIAALGTIPAPPGGLLLVACSGGADSIALAAATAFVAPRAGLRAGLVTVDHGLQEGSAERAEAVVAWARTAGLDPVESIAVHVPEDGTGPEAAARSARYAALTAAAQRHRAIAVLVGHTMEDQAETCLLALARGAGPRGLAGMPAVRELDGALLLRPLLGIRRATTRSAAVESGFTPWDDPHNGDPRYARSRVRHELLPALIDALGEGVVGNLAQTARQLAMDTDYLDGVAVGIAVDVATLAGLHSAIRGRVLHRFALEAGAVPSALGHRHVDALDALITRWHGQGPVWLPGGVAVARVEGRLQSHAGKSGTPSR